MRALAPGVESADGGLDGGFWGIRDFKWQLNDYKNDAMICATASAEPFGKCKYSVV
jgi:hypothetical protein